MKVFEERQELPVMFEILLHASLAIALAGVLFAQRPDPSAGPLVLVLLLLGMAAVWFLCRSARLTTRVDDTGVRVCGLWFVDRRIGLSDIAAAESRRYKPLLEYGGWGYRIGPSGKAYNMRGDEGVQLTLKDGGRVLIGSQRAQDLADAIQVRLQSGDRA